MNINVRKNVALASFVLAVGCIGAWLIGLRFGEIITEDAITGTGSLLFDNSAFAMFDDANAYLAAGAAFALSGLIVLGSVYAPQPQEA